jgi:rRNA maturation RNase YbeY
LAIHFHENDATVRIKNKNHLKNWLKDVILKERASVGLINIVFTTDRNLQEINREYLSRDYLTDVIAFDYTENQVITGDLFISVPRVKENAEKFNETFGTELKRVMVHGILHMLGYGDGSKTEKSVMRKMEDHYLVFSPVI